MLRKVYESLRRRLLERQLAPVSSEVRRRHLTYLSPRKLRNIELCLGRLDDEGVEGDCVEAGVALGGSAIVICKLMGVGRRFTGYDVFGMIPPPSDADDAKSHDRYETIASGASRGLGGERYYGYEEDLYDKVVGHLESFGLPVDGDRVTLVRGLFEDTLTLAADRPIAFAHIDCDWYEPVKLCLDRLYPVLARGGFVVSDDYHDYGGCRRAVDGFLAERRDMAVTSREGNLVMRRLRA